MAGNSTIKDIASVLQPCAVIVKPNTGKSKYPVLADENLMKKKSHGTCEGAPLPGLRWGVDPELADRICCFNRSQGSIMKNLFTSNFLNLRNFNNITLINLCCINAGGTLYQ